MGMGASVDSISTSAGRQVVHSETASCDIETVWVICPDCAAVYYNIMYNISY